MRISARMDRQGEDRGNGYRWQGSPRGAARVLGQEAVRVSLQVGNSI